MRLDYAIKFVGDMDSAVEFYRDALGLPLKFQSPFWSEFETGETTLALHPAWPTIPRAASGSASPPRTSTASIPRARCRASSSPARRPTSTARLSPAFATPTARRSRSVGAKVPLIAGIA